jgi:UDP-N-acetylmuramate: L-alanyl-gamma-D-glutamyl-meso-diaminopimelate ligase
LYNTKYLLLTALRWDHIDLFPTEESYVENFRNYIKTIPADGLIVANANHKHIVDVCRDAKAPVIFYSADQSQQDKVQWYLNRTTQPLPTLVRKETPEKPLEIIPFERKIVGDYNDENILAAAVLAYELGIKKERIQEGIAEFRGVKRRLEKRFENDKALVLDDLGSTPFKAQGALNAIRKDYTESKIIVIFEPNTGNRLEESLPLYKDVFDSADEVILPRFTKLLASDTLKRFGANRLLETLKEYGINAQNIRDDEQLLAYVIEQIHASDKHVVVAFLGSHGFRGMIEELVSRLQPN